MATDTNKMAGVLIGSIVAAGVIAIFGDTFVYDPETSNQTIGFETGSAAAGIIDIAPAILVALGLYGAFQYM